MPPSRTLADTSLRVQAGLAARGCDRNGGFKGYTLVQAAAALPCVVDGTLGATLHSVSMISRPVAFAALLFAAACQQESASAPEYRPNEAGTVDHAMCLLGFSAIQLREVPPGHHLVEARINGQSGSFVLDTGANVTVINEAQTDRFGVSGGGGLAGVAGVLPAAASGQANQVSIDSFEIGSIPIRQSRVVTADLGQLLTAFGRVAGEEVAGIIGQDVLTEHRAMIDVARPMLYLMEADEDPAPVASGQCQEAEQQEDEPAA